MPRKATRFKFEADPQISDYVDKLARYLGETQREPIFQLKCVVYLLGFKRSTQVLKSTLDLTLKKKKVFTYQTAAKTTYKRTVGGVFFKLAKNVMSTQQVYLFCHFRDCYRARRKRA